MLKKKDTTVSGHFNPYPFIIKRDRRRGIVIESAPIDWSSLDDDQFMSQWEHCLNRFWFYEKENIINKAYLKPYLLDFMKKNGYTESQIKGCESAADHTIPITMLSVSYLLMSGVNKADSTQWLKNKINKYISNSKTEVSTIEVKEKPKRDIQESMREKLSDVLGELHGIEDDADFKTKPDLLKWFSHKNVARVHMGAIEQKFKPILAELEEVLKGKNVQLNEGYSSYSKADIKKRIEWYKHFLSDVDAYQRLKSSNRKVRVRKPKPPSKLVAKLRYLNYSDDLKIQSVNAEKIVGSDAVWVYNQKYRRLILYVASELDKELSVKGSTIIGWDPKASYGKTLRKPEEQIKVLLSGGKVSMRNYLKDIKGKSKPVNGRINKDCLLLKVF